MTEAAERISEGDVDVDVDASSHDEIGRLARAFQGSVDYLKHMVDAAGQIAAGNLVVEIEPRSERDALGRAFSDMRAKSASAEEVSATTEQTSASTQQIAASAQELATTAEHLQRLVSQFTL